jgi:excinuclease ABC subunit C
MGLLCEELLSSLPTETGVYIMRDERGKVIYIGKAKNIRARVRSYFHVSSGDGRLMLPYLLEDVKRVDFIVTGTEREALMVENALIKKHKPKYNILLKDDKNYTSLRLDPKERFPKLVYTRTIKNDGAVYFGPFCSSSAMRQVKRIVHRMFPLRDCTDAKFKRHHARPCLNYFLKMCSAPCAGKIDEESYRELVRRAKLFLGGNIREIVKILTNSMQRCAEEMRYEEAAEYRDQIRQIEKNLDVRRLISGTLEDKDAVGFYRSNGKVEISVLFSRGGAIVDKAEYFVESVHTGDSELIEEFIARFYDEGRFIPRVILLPVEIESREAMANLLSERLGKRVAIRRPRRGEGVRLVELAMKNAREGYLAREREGKSGVKVLEGLKDRLSLSEVPRSIECYDISNIMGELAVASMVRFEDGKPAKSKYKRFKIKTIRGADDYAMMREVLSRRLERACEEGWELPKMILVDGGKGQLNIAHAVMEEFGIADKVYLASIAKARDDGEHDKIYKYGVKDPIPFGKNSKELLLLMRIRDEAHRFAIAYHKKLRAKRALVSALDLIPGIGRKRKQLLLSHFGTVEAIEKADFEELASIPGMNRKVAQMIKERLSH